MTSAPQSRRPLVFDLDGTLIDSRQDIAAAANHALAGWGRPIRSVEQVCAFVGNGAPFLLCSLARLSDPDISDQQALAALAGPFADYYLEHSSVHTTLLPGVASLLAAEQHARPEAVQGRALCVCTNKPRPVTDRIVETWGWGAILASVVGSGDTPHKKPHPAPLERVARDLGVPARELIMVGDGPQDIGAGQAVGAFTIGVRGGFLDEELLEASQPDCLLDTLEQLPEALVRFGL